jgi:hypothetical protein
MRDGGPIVRSHSTDQSGKATVVEARCRALTSKLALIEIHGLRRKPRYPSCVDNIVSTYTGHAGLLGRYHSAVGRLRAPEVARVIRSFLWINLPGRQIEIAGSSRKCLAIFII